MSYQLPPQTHTEYPDSCTIPHLILIDIFVYWVTDITLSLTRWELNIQKSDWQFDKVLKRNERSQCGKDPRMNISTVTAISLHQGHFTFISPSYVHSPSLNTSSYVRSLSYVRSPSPSCVHLLKTFQILCLYCSSSSNIIISKHSGVWTQAL